MKISRRQFVKAMAAMSAASMLAACGGSSGNGSSGGKKALTFQIWDVAQKEGMEAMCAAYTQQHPEVSIEVQVTSWNEYWTKLEAAATSNQMPDIFWMHTNELLKYADNGMLADCTDIVEKDKFSEVSLSNAMGSNGTLYAVPKDKDTVGLVYNKEMFDAAGVAYPDENWTWDDLVSAFRAKAARPSLPIRVWRIHGQAALQSIPSISSASLRCLSTASRVSTTPLARSGRARSMMSC